MSWREEAKRKAAIEAVKHIKDGCVIGLGSGTTATYAMQEIGRKIREEKLSVLGISTSHQTTSLAVTHGIPLTTLNEHPRPDIAIDGADQVDPKLNLIKGTGAALTREKIVDSSARFLIIVVDETKLTEKLGQNQAVPVEVLPFALTTLTNKFEMMGGKPGLRLSESGKEPLVTDNGNFILDVDFGPMRKPRELDREIKSIPGVVETGLFIGMTDIAYVGCEKGVKKLERK